MASNGINPEFLDGNKDILKYLDLYQREWEITINAQMHFNDLIVKYRQIFLTLYISLTTASLSLNINEKIISNKAFVFIATAILLSWVLAFLLDYCYYYQMLLASVEQAKKFDENLKLQEYGLFGLTKEISNRISLRKATTITYIFYGLPAAILVALICYKI